VTMKYGMSKREKMTFASMNAHVLMNHVKPPPFSSQYFPNIELDMTQVPRTRLLRYILFPLILIKVKVW
jgi:hypothetical protein